MMFIAAPGMLWMGLADVQKMWLKTKNNLKEKQTKSPEGKLFKPWFRVQSNPAAV